MKKLFERIHTLFAKPYGGALYFMVILIIAHFFWKFTMLGDESDTLVTFFGINVSAPFNFLAAQITNFVHEILLFLGYNQNLEPYNILKYENGNSVRIVWACSGLKQAYILFCIIAFYKGPLKKKLWYVPLGIIISFIFNLFRITVIAGVVKSHPEWFDLIHEHLFKYLYYGLIFGIWLFWDEKMVKKVEVTK